MITFSLKVLTIQNSVTDLLRDLITLRRERLGRNVPVGRKRPAPPSSVSGASASKRPAKSQTTPLTPEESVALRAEVAELNEEQQQRIVKIMMDNKETITTDDNGYTEIDLGSCSAKRS